MASIILKNLTKEQANAIKESLFGDFDLEDAINTVLEKANLPLITVDLVRTDQAEDPEHEVLFCEDTPEIEEEDNDEIEENETSFEQDNADQFDKDPMDTDAKIQDNQ